MPRSGSHSRSSPAPSLPSRPVRPNPWNLGVAGIACSWGFVSVIVAGVDLSGETLVFWRCALAALTLPPLLLGLGRLGALVPRTHRLQLLGVALLLAAHWVLFFETIKRASVAAAVLLGSGRALPSASEWPAVVVLGSLLTAVLGVLYVRLLREVTAQAAGLLSYLEPVSAPLLAWAILGEAVGWQGAVGGPAVLLGGALLVLDEGGGGVAAEAPAATAEE